MKVTLRKDQMYEFLDRLITMALPRVRDFRGVNGKSFDGRGNYAMGLKEHIVFVEIDYDKTETVWGMDIIFNTTAKTDAEAQGASQGLPVPVYELRTRRNGENEPDQPEQEAREDGGAIRRQARGAEGQGGRHEGAARGALRGASEAGQAAAQFVEDAHPSSLRAQRAAPRAIIARSSCRASRFAILRISARSLA